MLMNFFLGNTPPILRVDFISSRMTTIQIAVYTPFQFESVHVLLTFEHADELLISRTIQMIAIEH